MNLPLSEKLPLSPYSVFRVVPRQGRDGLELATSAQFRLFGTAVINEQLIGRRCGNGFLGGYNPFDLYGAAERTRCKPLPPHLVFAELDRGNEQDACSFLNAYGPLAGTDNFLLLEKDKLKHWKSLADKSPRPEKHFLDMLGTLPLLPDLANPEREFCSYSLSQFWEDQSEFEHVLRLQVALSSSARIQKIQQILGIKTAKPKGDGPAAKIENSVAEKRLLAQARKILMKTMNSHLATIPPRIAFDLKTGGISGVWGCHTLLQAMYLMLFLDIVGWGGRIAQCEKCNSLFYSALDKGRYCSAPCENRARALRAYHKKKGGA